MIDRQRLQLAKPKRLTKGIEMLRHVAVQEDGRPCEIGRSPDGAGPARQAGRADRQDAIAIEPVGVERGVDIAGEHDRNAPAAVMKKMSQAIIGSTFFEMRGIGHLQNLEAPEEFDAAILNFLALPRQLLH